MCLASEVTGPSSQHSNLVPIVCAVGRGQVAQDACTFWPQSPHNTRYKQGEALLQTICSTLVLPIRAYTKPQSLQLERHKARQQAAHTASQKTTTLALARRRYHYSSRVQPSIYIYIYMFNNIKV